MDFGTHRTPIYRRPVGRNQTIIRTGNIRRWYTIDVQIVSGKMSLHLDVKWNSKRASNEPRNSQKNFQATFVSPNQTTRAHRTLPISGFINFFIVARGNELLAMLFSHFSDLMYLVPFSLIISFSCTEHIRINLACGKHGVWNRPCSTTFPFYTARSLWPVAFVSRWWKSVGRMNFFGNTFSS